MSARSHPVSYELHVSLAVEFAHDSARPTDRLFFSLFQMFSFRRQRRTAMQIYVDHDR